MTEPKLVRLWRYRHKQTGNVIQFSLHREPPKPYQFITKDGKAIRMDAKDIEQYERIY